MSFSSGQIYFILFFVFAFLVAMIWAYTKDSKTHSKYYKGSIWIIVGIIIMMVIFKLILIAF